MKTVFLFFLSFIFSLSTVHAQVDAQNEIQNYWQWSQNQNQDASSVDFCLEKIYSGSEELGICEQAISDLTQIPLNPHRREILFSLLQKIPNIHQTHQQLELIKGLLATHPELAEDTIPTPQKQVLIPAAEVKAWRKVAAQKIDLTKAKISLNGLPLSLVSNFQIPVGSYQWTLLAPHFEPLIIVGTWNDFSTRLKDLKPSEEQKKWDITKASPTPTLEHLGDLPMSSTEHASDSNGKHSWIWPVVIAVGVGLALALKDKRVTVSMPGQN